MFDLITRAVTRWPRITLLTSLVLIVLGVAAGADVADRLRTGGYTGDGAESIRAREVLARYFPTGQPNLVLLVRAPAGVDAPAVAAAGRRLTDQLATEPDLIGVTSYWRAGSTDLRSRDGGSALIVGRIQGSEQAVQRRVPALREAYQGSNGPVKVAVGGPAAVQSDLETTAKEDIDRSELISIPIVALALMLVFRGVVAASLPLIIGITGVVGTYASLSVVAGFANVSIFSLNLATGLGLGLAVDYALFIVRRHREELRRGADIATAVRTALHTAGRTVAFSALAVMVSMSAMLVFPMYFLRSFGYAGISVALLAAFAALVPLTAALVVLGPWVDRWDLSARLAWMAGRRTRPVSPGGSPGWRRVAQAVVRHPTRFTVLTAFLLAVLTLPFFGIRFGVPDDRSLPDRFESHQVQRELREDYEARPTAAVDVVVEGIDLRADRGGLAAYAAAISRLDNVQRVVGATGVYVDGVRVAMPHGLPPAAGGRSYLTVSTEAEEISEAGKQLVRDIRALPAPFPTLVGGASAELVDTQEQMVERFPWAIGLVVLSTLGLLFLLSGGLLVPVKAVVMNALSLSATFGVLVWIFQDGNLSGLLDFQVTGWVAVQMLVLLFCVAFGVSMDYEVFLLSRIREEYARTGDGRAAVVYGVERTGGVITTAALVLSIVFITMGLTSRVSHIQMFGLGLAVAVLLDATVVRALLVPALMRLADRANWWAPRPLRRLHDRFGFTENDDRALRPRRPPVGPGVESAEGVGTRS